MDEEQFRERLTRMADGLPPPGESQAVVGRARRRIARNSALGAVLAGAVAVSGISFSANVLDREARPFGKPVEVAAVSGPVKCTARFPSTVVEPGRPLGVESFAENLSDKPFSYTSYAATALVIKDADGSPLWSPQDAPIMVGRPAPQQLTLPPSGRVQLFVADPIVSWPGPLSVTPTCHGIGGIELPTVRLTVFTAGEKPSASGALASALSKTGGLFDACRPTIDGRWNRGIIQPPVVEEPRGPAHAFPRNGFSPMTARCAARMEPKQGFWIVELIIVSPDSAPDVPLERDGLADRLPGDAPMLVSRFEFVVTTEGSFNDRRGRTASRTASDAQGRAKTHPLFGFDGQQWLFSGSESCGSTSISPGGGGIGIDFINACVSRSAYSNQDFGYALQYPGDFLREELQPREDFYEGELHLVRFYDKKFKDRYPDGQVILTLYLKDHPALDDWIRAHSGSADGPEGNNVYFRGVRNLERTKGPQDRTAFAFDWVSSEGGEGRTTSHSVAFHTRDKVAVMSWYVHDQAYSATLEPIFREMLASWRPEK